MLIDANLLVYAKMRALPQHGKARAWLEGALNGSERVGLPWPSLLAFLRLTTHPRIFDPPLASSTAWDQVREWLGLRIVWVPGPTEDHPAALGRMIEATRASGNLLPDAHLAAIALEHGLVVCSTDGDFARFPGIRWHDPLRG